MKYVYAVIKRENPRTILPEYFGYDMKSKEWWCASIFGALRFDDDIELEDYVIQFGGYPTLVELRETKK
jgi:hypothetical protein